MKDLRGPFLTTSESRQFFYGFHYFRHKKIRESDMSHDIIIFDTYNVIIIIGIGTRTGSRIRPIFAPKLELFYTAIYQ